MNGAMRRSLSVWLVMLIPLCLCSASAADPPTGPEPSFYQSFLKNTAQLQVLGASGCAGPQCHSRDRRPNEPTLGTEWDMWDARGKGHHAHAYKTLLTDRSKVMAELLYGKGVEAASRSECLACHALDAPPARRSSPRFDLKEGVQCESCHGPCQNWQQPHAGDAWKKLTAAQKVAAGMYDTRDLIHRAELCLSCHLGSERAAVTHDMYAAGHPELNFELAGDLFEVPRHWRDAPSLLPGESSAAFQARTWAVGQAVALREAARGLARWAESSAAPDFSGFECYACHHDLRSAPPTWRQQRKLSSTGMPAAPLGAPAWRGAGWAAGRSLAAGFCADRGAKLLASLDAVSRAMRLDGGQRAAVRTAALDVAAQAGALAEQLASKTFDDATIRESLRRLFEDGQRLAGLDFREAEQVARAAIALRVLPYQATDQKPPATDAIAAAILDLGKTLRDERGFPAPHLYDPAQFSAAARRVAEALAAK